jgi:hyperosmotically inducible protein
MRFRLTTLLCFAGLAACSQENNPPPQSAYDATEPTSGVSEPAMKPASLDEPRAHSDLASGTPAPDADRPVAPVTTDPVNPGSPAPANAATSPAVPPDNTKVNERDRNTGNLTPGDQNNNETDLKITQQIRQAVMADGSLSFTAKNVKIITQGGKVTLRGPVNTAQERSAIEAAARKVAGATQVDNQIEVKK